MTTRTQQLDEIKHDARQSIATILTLVAVTRHEVGDPGLALRRLDQVADQARALAGLLDEPSEAPRGPVLSDAGAVGESTVRGITAGYGGTVVLESTSHTWVGLSPAAVRRVVSNLVCNAMRAAGHDGVMRVCIGAVGSEVVIAVEDDGPGFGRIPVLHGIGLRSATRLVRRAGGRIDVGRSALGGAVVRVTLPAIRIGGDVFDENLAV